MKPGSMLTIRGLRKSFGTNTVLDAVDLDIAAGEIFTILGDSGCGKTTLLRILAGLETAEDGRVLWDGEAWVDSVRGFFLPPQKRGIGLVFQSYAVWPHLTVAQNVAYPLRRAGLGRAHMRERVEEVLSTVGLTGLGSRPATQLSGGQQQRVAMARALAPRPGLLLLDEPFSNLDVGLRAQLRHELQDIQKRMALTIILVTHDQLDAFTLSDRVAVLRQGRVEQVGTPQEIYEAPLSDYVRSFVGRSSALPVRVSRDSKGASVILLPGGGSVTIAADLAPKPGTDATLWVRPEDVLICSPTAEPCGAAEGRVRRSTFIGDRFETLVELDGGGELVAYQPRSHPFPPGTSIAVRLTQASFAPLSEG